MAEVAAVSRTHTHAVWHARALGSCSSQGIVGSACFLTKYIYLLNHVAAITSQRAGAQQPIVSERMMGPPPLTGNEEVEQHVKRAVLAAPQLAWPPGADSPGSWLRGALGTRAPAAHGPTGGCSAAVGPGQTR